jgi:hypothetical protein
MKWITHSAQPFTRDQSGFPFTTKGDYETVAGKSVLLIFGALARPLVRAPKCIN